MKLIVGLGNPGFLYARNRHNIGFMCVSHLARTHKITFDRKQGHARTGIGNIGRYKVVLARPQTYMNASGESVSALMKRLNVKPADLIVIHDDLDLPLGKIRMKRGRGWSGHQGVKSILNILVNTDSNDMVFIRVGIGRPEIDYSIDQKDVVMEYVLSDFTPEEKKIIDETIPRVGEAIAYLLSAGLTAAMNKYN